ncbi:dienelactone hydrolase family protein [Thalassolituus sp.]|uniref:dienelactone hydrolase family protein n=1 Tax=Thalassolituus sp. TaxID=2030822 RepID=UPI002A8037FA|nr:dienelactone hydrolase family protein [Thalassolituus sp.]
MSKSAAPQSRVIPQEAFDWYDEYAHGVIDRRTFMSRLATLTAVGLSIGTLTSALIPNYALAEQVSFNDADIKATYERFISPNGYGECQGYLVLPKRLVGAPATEKAPVVLVVHENRGLNPYIKDVARRLAKQGFIAFAPDALFPVGGYPGNDDDGRALQASMDKAKLEEDFIAAARYIKQHPQSNGKLGGVGFCYGGYGVNMLAASIPEELSAAVPFYGTPGAEALRDHVKGPIMLQFAGLDTRVNDTWPAYEAVLKENKADYVAYNYADVNHGFHNDSTGRYAEAEAELAWSRTLAFFNKHLM